LTSCASDRWRPAAASRGGRNPRLTLTAEQTLATIQAQRRKLGSDREYDAENDKYLEDKTRFYPIAGDVFVLRYEEVKTLNVIYLSLGPEK
jgi:hypothetical protein